MIQIGEREDVEEGDGSIGITSSEGTIDEIHLIYDFKKVCNTASYNKTI